MKKLILLLACAAVYSFSFAAGPAPVLTLKSTATAPKIDGKIDANDPYKTTDLISLTKNKGGNTTSAVTAKMYVTYDQTNLYMVTVESGDAAVDTDASKITNSYERDCMEVFIKLDTNRYKTNGTYIGGDYQYRQQRGAVFPSRFDNPGKPSSDPFSVAVDFTKETGFKIGQVDGATGFTMEWQVPWASLLKGMGNNASNWTGQYICYDEQVADNTTASASGRSQQLFWNDNSDNQWDDSRKFGVVYLTDKVNVTVAVNTPKTSDFSVNVTRSELVFSAQAETITIYALTGAKVASYVNKSTVNISNLKGAYIVTATSKGQRLAQKFIVK